MYFRGEVTTDKVEGVIGLDEEEVAVVAKIGASAASAKGALGLNIIGLRIGYEQEVRLGFDYGGKVGGHGAKFDTGPTSEGFDWGPAVGSGPNPMSQAWQRVKDDVGTFWDHMVSSAAPDIHPMAPFIPDGSF